MIDILRKIATHKLTEVRKAKAKVSETDLRSTPAYARRTISLVDQLPHSSGIIAEFKRKSPSKPEINLGADLEAVVKGYEAANVSGISILTDVDFFGGSADYLRQARAITNVPLLRKDFIIDPYQVVETKAMGADVMLLIAAILSPEQTKALATQAQSLGLEVLLEIHQADELEHLNEGVSLVGINNRNLRTFEVDLAHSIRLANQLPKHLPRISESGISDPETVKMLKKEGFEGFLIGETFMKTDNPGNACQDFTKVIAG